MRSPGAAVLSVKLDTNHMDQISLFSFGLKLIKEISREMLCLGCVERTKDGRAYRAGVLMKFLSS